MEEARRGEREVVDLARSTSVLSFELTCLTPRDQMAAYKA